MRIDNVEYSTFSGWIDPPADVVPALAGDLTCDVAVIGGGMGGMATALRLAERGQDVVLLEAQFCGYGSSSRNGGQIASVPGGDLRLLGLLHPKALPGMVRLAENSARFVEDLMKTHDIECDYEPNGLALAAVGHGQMLRIRTVAAILRRAGGHGHVGTSEELGIPRGFVGGMRESLGGMLNPGKLSRGVRRALLSSPARVFEKTKVTDVTRHGGKVVISTPRGTVHANKAVLATNAYSGEWDITPKRLSVPMWLIEMETEPIAPERIAALGWSSRSGVITQHQIMEHYRLTPRNTIVIGVRRIERGRTYPLPAKAPDRQLVEELAGAFATRFPALADVAVARAWGGWIAITSSWLSVAGRIEDNIYYSIACNGHGLAQAPYVGSLIADLIVDGSRAEDLDGIWAKEPKFPPFTMMGPLGLRTAWTVDRFTDLLNGSRRRALRAAARVR
ncbi:Glycine/D-amino acid oxidase (deaminating) [Streptoalloteichus tenebrarius]|uniref:Glycine/D-amino acid oxidase (Deaminating) n=1 Tax=Streptoalloteichus tenebrarius (strain ATCC 17920 / DSM 40477 / JCM 4838 / CBS 697.72 / NBRC 16177 / NCIMB 11028 / NRRL B-12390 / A12253. 1 / ISP 5477) TaxID=1933 RepID=A0ABT1HRV7_STRSD|nr:FAD-binding oxidoreductase [Streptoalloteichus tenebrarius]MCP2258170.1 Glycine/D-amino acid oxidase (deaminating) [Streptoalloteichus tenebrarius]BFF04603.1 FAD-dependent oxidoreductase [Streptoalloteichus tenebrarius]